MIHTCYARIDLYIPSVNGWLVRKLMWQCWITYWNRQNGYKCSIFRSRTVSSGLQ